jgi:hypothetical protein
MLSLWSPVAVVAPLRAPVLTWRGQLFWLSFLRPRRRTAPSWAFFMRSTLKFIFFSFNFCFGCRHQECAVRGWGFFLVGSTRGRDQPGTLSFPLENQARRP